MARIYIVTESGPVRSWIATLADALRVRLGIDTRIVSDGDRPPLPMLLETFERRMRRSRAPGASSWIHCARTDFAELAAASPDDICFDLTGITPVGAGRWYFPLFNDLPTEKAIISDLWAKTPATLSIARHGPRREIVIGAVLAIPNRELVLEVLDAIFSRLISLCLDVVSHDLAGKLLPPIPQTGPHGRFVGLAGSIRLVARGYVPKLLRQVSKRFLRPDDWAIATRDRSGGFSLDGSVPAGAYDVMPCPTDRFFADPFLFERDGEEFLFFEDYDYASGKAGISVATMSDAAVTQVLTRPYHLSYPFLLEHEGKVFMLPETSANRTVELYEAVRFPYEWRLHSTLLEDVRVVDATPFWDDRQRVWWMFAAQSEFGASDWDALVLFYSESLFGPWKPHPANPVKYDARSSRPAGGLIRDGDRLLRPAQDCSREYGGAISWCEIEELSPARYAEKVVGRRIFEPHSRFRGPHTFSQSKSFEAIDLKRRRWR